MQGAYNFLLLCCNMTKVSIVSIGKKLLDISKNTHSAAGECTSNTSLLAADQ